MRLFHDRARAQGSAVETTGASASSARGSTACRSRSSSPQPGRGSSAREELLERLGSQLAVLTAGPQDAPARHRTLATTIDWSYTLLADGERRLFEGLGAFAGGFSVDDVEAVLESDLDTLASLIDKSLVTRQADDAGRFSLLASVREFALARLDGRDDAEAVRRRHALFVLDEVARADGPSAARSSRRRSRPSHGGTTTCAPPSTGRPSTATVSSRSSSLCAAGWFWYVRGHLAEGRARLESALARADARPTATRGCACMRAGAIADAQNDLAATERFYREAYEIRRGLGDRSGTAGALNNLGTLALHAGDYATARTTYAESLALARELDDAGAIAAAQLNLALVDLAVGDPEGAVRRLRSRSRSRARSATTTAPRTCGTRSGSR